VARVLLWDLMVPNDPILCVAAQAALYRVVANTGLQALRDCQERLPNTAAGHTLALERFFNGCVRWKCEGWDV
jgi:hypothetical protein